MNQAWEGTGRLEELLGIMERLRSASGCPWDRAQTFASIAPYTIEEAYEVADAIERGDFAHLKDELGDLLFQVAFHAQIAREAGHFDFDAVSAAICDKLKRRHPHLFSPSAADEGPRPEDPAAQSAVWENIKARERGGAASSALDGVPAALPALMRAGKISKRAARVGFDFQRVEETADKVAEELAEVREAARETAGEAARDATREAGACGKSQQVFEEIGDLLFAVANLARKLEIDPETALRAANGKFERRFRGMELLAKQRGAAFESLSLAAQEALWQEVKRAE